jgi:hypothetical protein
MPANFRQTGYKRQERKLVRDQVDHQQDLEFLVVCTLGIGQEFGGIRLVGAMEIGDLVGEGGGLPWMI